MSGEGTGIATPEDITSFTAVDHTQEPDFFRRFLDEGNKLRDIVSSKPVILSGLRLTGGERVLDLGCGLGDDTFEIARVIGSRGRAVGVDVSETMILEARKRRAASLDFPVEFEVGDAQAFRFDDGAFHACRTERMLMHVPDAERAFAEMARVVCRGGRLSVFDFDWETQIVDSPYLETTRLITRSFCGGFKNGWIGRRLPRIVQAAWYGGHNRHASHDRDFLPVPGASARRASRPCAASRRCVFRGMRNAGGRICARRSERKRSFTPSAR
jgi:ubiquinone/menaquinone biosynthesis C-methylase UbiE